MERLKAEQLQLLEQAKVEVEGVKVKTCRDVTVLEFPENGARLLVNRWRPGYSERRLSDRAQSAQGRRTRSSPQLSRAAVFQPAQVKPVQAFQTLTGGPGVSVMNFELRAETG